MITNERQYKIAKNQAERFRQALDTYSNDTSTVDGVHPRIALAEREAMLSQLADLDEELVEYDRLKSSNLSIISIRSFDDLPEGLIKARIASGLSQKALAEKMGLKEQQIQRYESERYSSASYQRLREVAEAIGIRMQNDILLPVKPRNFSELVSKLSQVGLDRDFLLSRLMSSADATKINDQARTAAEEETLTGKCAAVLERMFGWSQENIFGAVALHPPRFAAAEARFKMPRGRSQASSSVYATYANYLAVVVIRGAESLPRKPIPTDANAMRKLLLSDKDQIDLRSALHTAWDFGVAVLPLHDRGTFHGACWRYVGRNVIVLKQTSRHESRWLFDLLHELFHAGQKPETDSLEILESDETSEVRRNSDEEVAASQFAGDVLLDNKADALALECVRVARNSVENLKKAVPRIAAIHKVSVDALANYMAARLSWQGLNWWGAAANLQAENRDPWGIARDVFLERFPYQIDNDLDRELLSRALS